MVRRWLIALLMFLGLCGTVVAIDVFGNLPGLRFSVGSSLPTRLVWYTPNAPIKRGQIVAACLPQPVADVLHHRGIHWPGSGCPTGDAPVFKIVAAVAGDKVMTDADGVLVNGVRFPMSEWTDAELVWPDILEHAGLTQIVPAGYVWLIGWNPRSIDSRDFGGIPVSSIRGRIDPVWPGAGIFTSTNTERQK